MQIIRQKNKFYLGLFGNYAKLGTGEVQIYEILDHLVLANAEWEVDQTKVRRHSWDTEDTPAPSVTFNVDKKHLHRYRDFTAGFYQLQTVYARGNLLYREKVFKKGHIHSLPRGQEIRGGAPAT